MSDAVPPGPILFAMTHSMAGGLREIWNDVAEGLRARGHAVGQFVLYPPAEPWTRGVPAEAWRPIASCRPRSPLAALRLLRALVRHLRVERPAAIVTAMPAANVIVPLAVALARTQTRVYLSHHSPAETHHAWLDRLDGWTGRLACVAGVVCVSASVAASLAHRPAGYLRKLRTIHNALPERIERLIDGLTRPPSARGAPARVVALGRLTRQKNYPLLIAAMARVPGARLEIVGGGEDEAALRGLVAEHGLGARVDFVGLLPREAALARAAAADIFVQASLYEGHSLALIEAARLGLPIVVSDVPVQVEAITARDGTRCGIAVRLDDPIWLAAAIAELAACSERRAHWSALARRLAAEASRATMLDRYEALLASPRPDR